MLRGLGAWPLVCDNLRKTLVAPLERYALPHVSLPAAVKAAEKVS